MDETYERYHQLEMDFKKLMMVPQTGEREKPSLHASERIENMFTRKGEERVKRKREEDIEIAHCQTRRR